MTILADGLECSNYTDANGKFPRRCFQIACISPQNRNVPKSFSPDAAGSPLARAPMRARLPAGWNALRAGLLG
jgi:hypothetical protein